MLNVMHNKHYNVLFSLYRLCVSFVFDFVFASVSVCDACELLSVDGVFVVPFNVVWC